MMGFAHKNFKEQTFLTGWATVLFSFVLLISFPAFGQEDVAVNMEEKGKIRTILLLLSNQMDIIQNDLDELSKLPATKRTQNRKNELVGQLDALKNNFESLASQQQVESLYKEDEKKSQWVKQVEALALPLLQALAELTEKPRKIEQLKTRIKDHQEKLEAFQNGSHHIDALLKLPPAKDFPDESALELYQDRLKKLERKYDPQLVQLKLEEAKRALANELKDNKPILETISDTLQAFFKHRGLNLLIAVTTFVTLWWLLMRVRVLMVGKRSLFKIKPWIQKVIMTIYSIAVLIACIISSMVVLYILNDWMLLSIIILFMVAVVWTSRQLIPRMFKEVRLALNLGTVKEQERVIWNGVPWLVESIGLQAILTNDQLEGGSILLPVGELVGMHSRPVVDDEPWFPTRAGDWVLLSDATYGQVLHQTQEQVVLTLKGNTLKFLSTDDFLELNPMNLSTGFRYEIDLGLDHELQSRICDEVPEILDSGLRKHLASRFEGNPPDFSFLKVSFDQAKENALHLKIIVDVDGLMSGKYDELQREVQTTLIRICNENQWKIPFTQVTLNLSKDLTRLAESRSPRDSD